MQIRQSSMADGVFHTYYFEKNLQGDIIGVYNSSGALVYSYVYDAWGNCTATSHSTTDTYAVYNPFRYRGYYYDTDFGFYYLNSSTTSVYESFDGEVREVVKNPRVDYGISGGQAAAYAIGYHYDYSISFSGMISDVIEYINNRR